MSNELMTEKMLAIVEKIQGYCVGLDYEAFSRNDMLVEACVFNLSQLGEMSNRIDDEFEEKNSQIPWRQLYGLRNRIIHDYEGVNLQLVWEIIEFDLPELKRQLLNLDASRNHSDGDECGNGQVGSAGGDES